MRGRRSWPVEKRKAFALRLYRAIRVRFGERAPFERLKKALRDRRAVTSEATVRGWLPPITLLGKEPAHGTAVRRRDWDALRTPDLPALAEVADALDVSIDYLVGYGVPSRRSERELVTDLANQLLLHVVKDYDARSGSRRRDGLAAVLGGQLQENQPFPAGPGWSAGTELVQLVGPGRVLTNRGVFGLQHLQVEAAEFLQTICDRIFHDAQAWEEANRERERSAVRSDVAELVEHLSEVAAAERQIAGSNASDADVARRLTLAALDPLNPRWQAEVYALKDHLRKGGNRDVVLQERLQTIVNHAVAASVTTEKRRKSSATRERRAPSRRRRSKGSDPQLRSSR